MPTAIPPAATLKDTDGLICAHLLDARGGSRQLDWEGVRGWTPDQGTLWIHLHRQRERVHAWLEEESGLPWVVWDALLAEETRPRAWHRRDGLLVNLRGVNLNPGEDPEDMVSIRMWFEEHRVVSLAARRIVAVEDVTENLTRGEEGPEDAGELLVQISEALLDRMAPTLEGLGDEVDAIEDRMEAGEVVPQVSRRLTSIRRQAIQLRRHVGPQRDALHRLQTEPIAWVTDQHRAWLTETTEHITRLMEELDETKERVKAIQDDMVGQRADQLNRRMFVITLAAGIFLPLAFITGLLGINVGGMPGADSPEAFWVVSGLMIGLIALELFVLRLLRWL